MTPFIIVAVIVALTVAAIRFFSAYIDGLLDGQYPLTANGDYRNGIARSVYALGMRRGEIQIKLDRERRALAHARRVAKS